MIKNLKINNEIIINNMKIVKDFNEFINVFSVFTEEPFFEKWSEKEIKEEFDYIKENGEIIGYYLNGNLVGILDLIDGAKLDQPVKFDDPKKVLYISDVAIQKGYRGKGYAKELVKELMNQFNYLTQYDYAYLRTNLYGSMSERLFIPYEFKDMYNQNNLLITQTINFPRTISISENDDRKFLYKRIR